MKKNIFKFLIVTIALVLSLGILCACDKEENSPKYSPDARGQFYTLQTAYDNGMLTLNDLNVVADILNNCQELDIAEVDPDVLKAVRALYYNGLCDDRYPNGKLCYPNAKVEDVSVGFYGVFNGSYCFRISDGHSMYPGVMVEDYIAGVRFYYSGPNIIVWRE